MLTFSLSDGTRPGPGFYPDPTLFAVLALPAGLVARIAGAQTASFLLGVASLANVAWVYAVARRSGAESRVAILAAFFMATAMCMTYYATPASG